MNEKILPDDPRLTAYALGELEDGERAAVAAALRGNPAAQAVVESIRATVLQLESALAHEPSLEPERVTKPARPAPVDPYERTKQGKLLRFPQVYYLICGLAAACFVAVIVWREPPVKRMEKKFYRELTLAQPPVEPPAVQTPAPASIQASAHDAMNVPDAPNTPEEKAEPAELSPFGFNEKRARGRVAVTTLAGRRMQAEPEDVASNVTDAANTEAYAYRRDSDFLAAAQHPLSTFSVDVDTASYANVRRFLQAGQLPPPDAVRIEELINYFPYQYAPPAGGVPLAASMEVADAPWAPGHRLVRIGLKGRVVATAKRGAANLVFLLDVSGSMNEPNKLPLVKESLRLLLRRLRADDRVAIVTYAGASGLALPSTPMARSREIADALDRLAPGGSTNGAMGIQLAYDVAKAHFVHGGINRVILCTDGDFNVGVASEGGLVRLIAEKARSGVFLTVLGFGMGNYKDATLEQLADAGNGNYGYIDTRHEAEKLLVGQMDGTLVTIAKDVKLQVEFNPAQVASYRLIGYENRLLQKEDFNRDTVDAGEIGAGHTVTALYEIVPVTAKGGENEREADEVGAVDPLKYRMKEGKPPTFAARSQRLEVSGELLTLKVRYKEPAGSISEKLEFSLTDHGARFADASADFKLAAAVAGFGLVLRDSPCKGTATLASVATWAEAASAGADPGGYRSEFIGLVHRAEALQ
jgi:Ca-activated chloride channel family protein